MRSPRAAFTLIELLVVIAIIAVLSVVVVLSLNPAELLRQSRDANRLSDLSTLNSALNLYSTDQAGIAGFSLGNASSVYVSLPDTSSTCGTWSLPTLPAGYTYACATATSSKNINSTGWIPVIFSNISGGTPFGNLPVDGVNQSSTGLYYAYYTNGNQFIVTAIPESQKQKQAYGAKSAIANYPDVMANGSNLGISPLWNPGGLVSYWTFDEGMGTTEYDLSGNGNNGSFSSGVPLWQSNCKIGNCLEFPPAGANTTISVNNASTLTIQNNLTILAWIKMNSATPGGGSFHPLSLWTGTTDANYVVYYCGLSCGSNNTYKWYANAGGSWAALSLPSPSIPIGSWVHIGMVYANAGQLYWNGVPSGSPMASGNLASTTNKLYMGNDSPSNGDFLMDDVRIYNRALSPAEVQAIYNAEK